MTAMPFRPVTALVSLAVILITMSFCANVHASHEVLIRRFFDLAADQQAKQDQAFAPLKWFKQKGIYKSSIKLNFHGPPMMAEGRRLMDVYDNNMFATAWVTSSLLEAFRFNSLTRPSEQQLGDALDVIYAHRNLNTAYNTSTFAFWQQRYNKTVDFWASSPANLLSCFDLLNKLPLPVVEEILKDMGFKAEADILKQIKSMESGYLQAFHIPPDFDDTFVNLGLGSLLKEMSGDFGTAWEQWSRTNTNITSVFDALKRYAYRPFTSDTNANAIDPRTYYYIRGFLDQAYSKGQGVVLVTTWIQSFTELQTQFAKGVAMPFSANNVDLTVAANTIFGMTSSVLSGIVTSDIFDDKDIAQIYLNTTSLIAYMINNNITDRPDLALTYYPSEIEFFWFVSRTTSAMDTYILQFSQLQHPVLRQAHATLTTVLQDKMTESVLSKAKKDDHGDMFFDDFLGNGDLTFDNKTFNRAEDRIFTTTMAVNALLYTWTLYDKQENECLWKYDTPESVKATVERCVHWLGKHSLDGNYDPWNAFFSGSVKGPTTLPFWYPANLVQRLNGTVVKDWHKYFPHNGDRVVVSGYLPKEEYDAMLAKPHFNRATPRVFHGYNADPGWFPFWSSEAYTYATTLLALARYDHIKG